MLREDVPPEMNSHVIPRLSPSCHDDRKMTDSDSTIRLPGYEAQLDESGVEHSRRKLLRAAEDLARSLPGVTAIDGVVGEGGDSHRVIDGHDRDGGVVLDVLPCRSEGETVGYRCRCSFQLVPAPASGNGDASASSSSVGSGPQLLVYAMRHRGFPVPLGGDYFPIATPRIQCAMRSFLREINSLRRTDFGADGGIDGGGKRYFRFPRLRHGLTSVSFASSWDGTDCLATVHYSEPLLVGDGDASSTGDEREGPTTGRWTWTEEAERLRLLSNLTALTGRSRGVRLSVPLHHQKSSTSADRGEEARCEDDDAGASCIIRDEVRVPLIGRRCPRGGGNGTIHRCDDDGDVEREGEGRTIVVKYRKPETAFQHPNGGVMVQALEWILRRLVRISEEEEGHHLSSPFEGDANPTGDSGGDCRDPTATALGPTPRPNLLEMYCGFGAHTIPISKTGAFGHIVAVELDQRLVDACMENVELNDNCGRIDDDPGDENAGVDDGERRCGRAEEASSSSSSSSTPVHVVKSDAGEVARRILGRRRRAQTNVNGGGGTRPGDDNARYGEVDQERSPSPPHEWTTGDDCLDLDFDVLLVDPPRQGLDRSVCRLATEGGFSHVIYVSCGRSALVRDLAVLSDVFDVASCRLLDLFPRTDSVETLVHLTRRRGGRAAISTAER